ncbi:FtsW/RodA/SpoVE family cell cycle protein [Isoptericola sp. NEAU-Y5]|uniref:FtsW/RodA/SpoVE family cell cycle protein n=1 Tax=Isoptericola luteus TaxID=2879484 RepID=A0ABS7ZJY9_9MICO|nr:FtsW/RodA/SpoVE family cell cycle protein [Isoptericola sp. NEAU-Y5]MCA5894110.1 FtsW/RodA/SpoVE family cell cycle protein [Isoptericola sp. NEAU-Y5]
MSTVEDSQAARTVAPTERRPARVAELFLLVLALAAGITAFATVGNALTGELPEDFWLKSFLLAAAGLGMHVVLRLRAPWADQVILPSVVFLNGIGLAMILRLEMSGASNMRGANAWSGLMYTALGAAVAAVLIWFLRDHRWIRRFTYTAMLVGLVLVVLPLFPVIGQEINGARIWVHLGGMSMQPAEFAKIAFAVFFAGYLVANRDTLALAGPKVMGLQLPRIRDLGPILIVWAASLGVLIFEHDLGTSLLFFGLFVAMLYLATERFSWVLIGLLLFGAGAIAASSIFTHVAARMEVWLHPFDAALYNAPGGSFQIVQGTFALAAGGMFGTGWGEGEPYRVPFAYSDFIYSSLGEELGLTGLLAILLAYLLIVHRGLRTAIAVRDGFGKLLAGGLAFVMALQIFTVVGGITRIIPLTGLTLPFMAQGGSSLLANWIVIALLLRVSDIARRPSSLPVRGTVAAGGAMHDPIVVGAAGGTPGTGTPVAGTPVRRSAGEVTGAAPSSHPTEMITPAQPDTRPGERS